MTSRRVLASLSLLLVGLLGAPPPAHATDGHRWELSSAGVSAPSARVALSRDGRLSLTVHRRGAVVLERSALGVRTPDADLTRGLRFAGRSTRKLSERYTTIVGRRRQHVDHSGVETTLRFRKRDARLDLVVRTYADGVAYRYVIGGPNWVTVLGEASEFAVPRTADAYLLPYDNGRGDYESAHLHSTVAAAQPIEYGYPSLFKVGDSWLLLTESDLNATYGGSRVALDVTSRTFRLTLPDPNETSPGPLRTPWRTMIVGDLATVTESDLVTDLAAPSKIADTSWIKPGISAWSWWSEGTGNLARQKQYVDYASRMGWEYNLVDSGWSADWMPALIEYAKQRGVGIILWVRWQTIDTDSERARLFPLYASWGAAGLKIDFVESDGQDRMRWYDAVLAATAQHKLSVNFHGAPIPRGTERTWPHVMSVEAVKGGEGTKPRPGKVPFPIEHYLTLPFTRNLQGSMDFTPVTFTGVRPTSDGHELALAVLYESGIQHFADRIDVYAAYPLAERFLRVVPAAWDETKLLAGEPGKLAVLARRHGQDWFVGAGTAGPATTAAAPLHFLPAGDWIADIYSDGADGKLALRSTPVTRADTLTVPVAVNGGFAVQLCPARPGSTTCAD
jgi:hypothetical protein